MEEFIFLLRPKGELRMSLGVRKLFDILPPQRILFFVSG
jgi:hypothetical protein